MTDRGQLVFQDVPEGTDAVITIDGRVYVNMDGLLSGFEHVYTDVHTSVAAADDAANGEDPQAAYTHGIIDGGMRTISLMRNGMHQIQAEAFDTMPLADEPEL